MPFISKLQKDLADAKAAGDKQRVSRLARMILQEERKARLEAGKAEDQRRKAREEFVPSQSHEATGPTRRKHPHLNVWHDFVLETERKEVERAAKAEEARRQEEMRKEAERVGQERAKRRQEQEKKHRRQKKNSARSQQPPLPRPAPYAPVTMPEITSWRTFCGNCFDNTSSAENAYAKIFTFPTPPGGCCGQLKCIQDRDRLNKTCDCNIRRAFRLAGIVGGKEAKKEMTKWHPDKFSACVEEKRKGFQKMANEVFVVLSQVARDG